MAGLILFCFLVVAGAGAVASICDHLRRAGLWVAWIARGLSTNLNAEQWAEVVQAEEANRWNVLWSPSPDE